jgi:hypothetical protein
MQHGMLHVAGESDATAQRQLIQSKRDYKYMFERKKIDFFVRPITRFD